MVPFDAIPAGAILVEKVTTDLPRYALAKLLPPSATVFEGSMAGPRLRFRTHVHVTI
jgi:hypothetical protein